MIPNDPSKTYIHKKTGKKFRVTGLNRSEKFVWIDKQPHYKWMVSIRFKEDESPCKLFFDEYDNKYKEVFK